MEDLRSILTSHHSKHGPESATNEYLKDRYATTSEIPDLFFDDILVKHKLNRIEILLLMYLYRLTWCKPNLHRKYGIAPIISHSDVAENLDINIEIFHQSIRNLESFKFIETIRSGQYFVRKYFTEEYDKQYGQTYDNFL
jgi:DNA-binding MarR family transcriptional regulator